MAPGAQFTVTEVAVMPPTAKLTGVGHAANVVNTLGADHVPLSDEQCDFMQALYVVAEVSPVRE